MFSRALLFLVLAGVVGIASMEGVRAAETTRVTLTGTGKALNDVSGKANPGAANATLTVADGTVYYVYGWAGVIVAKQGDGKTVEVTGVVYDKSGHKTITGKSIDVKIVVVGGK